jgi:hypothetical protein
LYSIGYVVRHYNEIGSSRKEMEIVGWLANLLLGWLKHGSFGDRLWDL